MLPTRINVLPPEKQRHLQRMIRSEFIRSTLALMIIVAAIIGIALLGGRSLLQTYFGDLADTINAVTVNTKDKNSKITQANSRIQVASRVVDTYTYWPGILLPLSEALPETVIVNRMDIQMIDETATITGVADTRDALLNFGEKLRTISFVRTVDIPISQLTEREDISFTIRIILNI